MKTINSILLIDDDEASNFINELLIKRRNITNDLLLARNGKEAIDLIRQRNQVTGSSGIPDLILLDINMPVMDGFGFLEAFGTLEIAGKESVVVAVLTSSIHTKDVDSMKTFGIQDFLNKPLTSEKLSNLLEKHFHQPS